MEYEFLCPGGHLLQGNETMVGQQCKCPYCDVEFLVPPPSGQAPADQPVFDEPAAPEYEEGAYEGEEDYEEEAEFPGIRIPGAVTDPDEVPAFGVSAAERAPIVHVICPNKHVLETPRDMLGEDAMCPYCEAQFRLRFEDTEEYRRELEEQRERHEQKLGRAWMNWAIAVAVVVVLGVITLVVVAVAD